MLPASQTLRRRLAAPLKPAEYQATCWRISRTAVYSPFSSVNIFAWRRIISETSFQSGFPSPPVSSLKIQGFPLAALPTAMASQPVTSNSFFADAASLTSPFPMTGMLTGLSRIKLLSGPSVHTDGSCTVIFQNFGHFHGIDMVFVKP